MKGKIVSVNLGFLYMAVLLFGGGGGSVYGYVKIVQGVVFSVSAVNCSLGCRELKSSRIFCMSVWLKSNISKISSTYLQ